MIASTLLYASRGVLVQPAEFLGEAVAPMASAAEPGSSAETRMVLAAMGARRVEKN